jgi:hypothetical protein
VSFASSPPPVPAVPTNTNSSPGNNSTQSLLVPNQGNNSAAHSRTQSAMSPRSALKTGPVIPPVPRVPSVPVVSSTQHLNLPPPPKAFDFVPPAPVSKQNDHLTSPNANNANNANNSGPRVSPGNSPRNANNNLQPGQGQRSALKAGNNTPSPITQKRTVKLIIIDI